MTEIQQHTMSRDDAERLTERIRLTAVSFMETRDKLARYVREAQEGQAHIALGYRSWTEYIAQVFSDTPLMRLTRDERRVIVADLAEQGMSTRAIAPVVGAPRETVRRMVAEGRDPNGSPASPSTPAEPTFDPTPAWDVTAGEITDTPEPRPVTGLDGKTYTRPEPKETIAPLSDREAPTGPKRRPLPDQFRDATVDLRKITERLEKLIADDRFPQNREQVALKHQSDLSRASTALAKVIDAFNIN